MHELTVCVEILNSLTRYAKANGVSKVKKIWLEIGELAGIDVSAIAFSFPIAAKRTVAQNATLKIKSVSGSAWCEACQHVIMIHSLLSACPECGGFNYSIKKGRELRILKMEAE